jgi:surfeit locus 1 family protein
MVKLIFSRRWWWTTLLVLAAMGVLVRLGFWQLDRLAQRQVLNTHVKAVQAAPVLVISDNIPAVDLTQMEYGAVKAIGRFDYDHQVAIRNQVWTQSWGDENGYALLTPLVLPNGQAVWVERGWIPAQYNTPDSWRQFDEPGAAPVEGLIRLPLKKGEMGGGVPDPTLAPGQARLDFWNYVNIERLRQQVPYPLLPVYIQQTVADSPTPLPYRLLPKLDLNDGPHLGFAMMWFFYAILLCVGYPFYLKGQEKRNHPKLSH